jgi:hypothetical protein
VSVRWRRGRRWRFSVTYFLHDVPAEVAAAGEDRRYAEANIAFGQPCAIERWPDVPTRVIASRDDRFFPMEFQRGVARGRLGADVDEIPGGHLAALSRPVELTDRLTRYLCLHDLNCIWAGEVIASVPDVVGLLCRADWTRLTFFLLAAPVVPQNGHGFIVRWRELPRPDSGRPSAAALTCRAVTACAVHNFMTLATGPMRNHTPSTPSPFVWPGAVSPLK